MAPIHVYPENNCIVFYIMYDISNINSVLTSSTFDGYNPYGSNEYKIN